MHGWFYSPFNDSILLTEMRITLLVLLKLKKSSGGERKKKEKKSHYHSGVFKMLVKKEIKVVISETLHHYLVILFWLTSTQSTNRNVISNMDEFLRVFYRYRNSTRHWSCRSMFHPLISDHIPLRRAALQWVQGRERWLVTRFHQF